MEATVVLLGISHTRDPKYKKSRTVWRVSSVLEVNRMEIPKSSFLGTLGVVLAHVNQPIISSSSSGSTIEQSAGLTSGD